MSLQHYQDIADLLLELEWELRKLALWEMERPSAEQLASQQPFAIDTLTFPQWLQFIFVERMAFILQEGIDLPAVSGIHPMAEEYFRESPVNGEQVITILRRFDLVVQDAHRR